MSMLRLSVRRSHHIMTLDHNRNKVLIDSALVRRLVADQFPQWSKYPVTPVKAGGHDNRTFHLGDNMCVRLPSAQAYAAHVMTEQVWLPKLARQLPLPIPIPLAMGKPAEGFPWRWSINKWLPGENATPERIDSQGQFANDLACFLNTLQSIDTEGAPSPGQDNFFRGGELFVYDSETHECIDKLSDIVDVQAALTVWESAVQVKCLNPPVWIHGDVAAGNLLVQRGRLCAVIDFGQLAAGDPACDVTIAWTFFSGGSRETFRDSLQVDEATWVRGRGWGLWKALLELRTHRQASSAEAVRAQRVINDILTD
jgi:aminoglycoside phosphotransferase (APT) family kinase protein